MLASAHSVSENGAPAATLFDVAEGAIDYSVGAEVALSRVRVKGSKTRLTMTRALAILAGLILIALFAPAAFGQQTNPVDRKVENPVTDTPYVNPLQQDQPVRRPPSKIP